LPLCAFAFFFSVQAACAAPPKLNSVFPAGAQRGQSVTVTVSGTFGHWPVRAWVDRPGIEVVAAEEKNKLTVKVAPDAAPGVCWFRLYDDEGATSSRPFVVGTLPEIVETEPNDDRVKPQSLESSTVVVNGRLEKSGDVDTFAVRLQRGQTLVASIDANRTFGSPVDATLQIVAAAGFVLAQNDDYHDLDPQLVFTAPADGSYLVRTFGFPATPTSTIGFAGGDDFTYRLTITTGGFVEYALPLAVQPSSATGEQAQATTVQAPSVELFGWNISDAAKRVSLKADASDATETIWHPEIAATAVVRIVSHATILEHEPNGREAPQTISLPITISGRIDSARDIDVYQFPGKKGDKLLFRAESRSLGFPLDPFLRLMDASGKTLSEIDDSGGGRDAEVSFEVPADGEYQLMIRDLHGHGGDRYVYRLTATHVRPDFNLKLAADSFVLTPGKPLEIPLTVERLNGFAGAIEIAAERLPAAVTSTPAKSAGSGESSKSVKITIVSDAGPRAGPFRIVGRVTNEASLTQSAVAVLPTLNTTTIDLWLAVLKSP
jgi:hypothetical protein